MSTFQQITIIGHLGDDPQSKTFENGDMVTNISIATTETWVDKQTNEKKESTEWHRCVAYRKAAEVIDKYCKKGDKILVLGKLKTRKWTDNQNIDRWTTEIVIETFKFLTSKGQPQQQGSAVEAYQNNNNAAPATNFKEEEHDDLPF